MDDGRRITRSVTRRNTIEASGGDELQTKNIAKPENKMQLSNTAQSKARNVKSETQNQEHENVRITRAKARQQSLQNSRITRSKAKRENINIDAVAHAAVSRTSRNKTRTKHLKPREKSEQLDVRDKSTSSNSDEDIQSNPIDIHDRSSTPSDTDEQAVDQRDRSSSPSEIGEEDVNVGMKLDKIGSRELLNKNLIIYEFQITGNQNTKFLIDHMASFETLLNDALLEIPNLQPMDRIQMNIISTTVDHHISTPITLVRDFNTAFLLAAIQAASQSGQNLKFDDNIRIDIRHLKLQNSNEIKGGKNRRWYKTVSIKAASQHRRCIVRISNHDNLCLSRAIVVGVAHAQKHYSPKKAKVFERLRKKRKHNDSDDQTRRALQYCAMAHVSPHQPGGVAEIKRFEKALNIHIKIIAADNFCDIVYDGMKNSTDSKLIVYLLRYMNENEQYHYDTISNIKAFYFKRDFCDHCNKAYDVYHRCMDVQDWCYSCHQRECNFETKFSNKAAKCPICEATFRNKNCKTVHKRRKCYTAYYCFICKYNIKRKLINGRYETNEEVKQSHWCGRKCSVCKQNRHPLHRCYLQKTKYKTKSSLYLFLDFETDQSSGEHIPIYCHLKWSKLIDADQNQELRPKPQCHDDDHSASEEEDDEPAIAWDETSFGIAANIQNDVGDFIFHRRFRGYTIIAHNMKGFDGCFLMRYLAENGTKPTIILRDKKILAIIIPQLSIRIIDSLNFLPMPLSAFAKAFNLSETKGYFPHFFSNCNNFTYSGPMPPKETYGTRTMKPLQLTAFVKWYAEQIASGHIFTFKNEMALYCKQDVDILQQGCWMFREQILSTTNNKCDAFQYLTLAGLCNAVYKKQFMPKHSIAAVPPNGYADIQNFSSKSLEWLTYMEKTFPDIRHIGNSAIGEATVSSMRVDGFIESSNTVFEFYGCFYHACPKCFPNKYDIHPLYKKTFEHVHSETIQRKQRLQALKMLVRIMWECDWDEMKKNSPAIQTHIMKNEHRLKPLNPFTSFFGGRVETFKMLVREEAEEKIKYEDVNSLYPFINATKRYPVGHPTMIFNNFGACATVTDRYFGFVYAAVLPPKQLHIPVLPGKYGEDIKLLFVLCRTCAFPRNTSYCTHSDSERMLYGTWFTEELKLACQQNYTVHEIFGIYHFEQSSSTLFSEYIKTFFKLKLLASGKPDHCVDEDTLQKYIAAVLKHDGVDLNNEQFSDNPSLRSVSKLMLNTLWGKFGTRRILPHATFCSDISNMRNLFDNQMIEVTNIVEIHKNMVIAISKEKSVQSLDMNNHANIYIASATTAYARIELYNYLSKVNDRALYCDTDSLIYISKPCNDLPTGDFLGQLKNELRPHEHITQFVSGGPKNYAYVTNQGVVVVKIKGFSLTATNLTAFKFDNIVAIVAKHAQPQQEFVTYDSKNVKKQKRLDCRDRTNTFHLQNSNTASAYHDDNCISVFNPNKIKISFDWKIKSSMEHKMYMCAYDKRLITRGFDTLPFGYCAKLENVFLKSQT